MDWITGAGEYLGIFTFMVLTGCGLPVPEEAAIIYAGVQSAQGDLSTAMAFGACLLGALVGDAVMYGIGYRFGHSLLRRHPKFAALIHAEREANFEQAVRRHGFKVLLLSRFMVGVRGPVYLAAGSIRMPFRRFLVWDAISATLVVSVFFAASYALGDDIARLLRDAEVAFTVVVLLVACIAGYILLRRRAIQLTHQGGKASETNSS